MRAAGNGVVAKIAARIALAALVAAARWPENGVGTFIIGRVPQRKLVQKSCSVAANCHVANVRRLAPCTPFTFPWSHCLVALYEETGERSPAQVFLASCRTAEDSTLYGRY